MSFLQNVILPFTAGNIYTSEDGREYRDGAISTVVVVTSVLAFVTVLIFLQSSAISGHVALSPAMMRASLTAMVFAGILATLFLGKHISSYARLVQKPRSRVTFFFGLRIGFLWLFGISVVIICIINLAFIGDCAREISKMVPLIDVALEIAFIALRIILVLTECAFIAYFVQSKFPHSLKAHYSIVFIIAANMTVWIYFFAINRLTADDMISLYNITSVHTSNVTNLPCYQNSTLAMASRSTERILYPVNTEFSLLVIRLVLEMRSPDMNVLEFPDTKQRNRLMGIETDEEQADNQTGNTIQSPEPDENSRLLDINWEYRIHNTSHQLPDSVQQPPHLPLYFLSIGSVLTFLPLLVMYIVLESKFSDNSEFYKDVACYEAFYKSVLLGLIVLSWTYLQKDGKQAKERNSFQISDFVLLLCTFGSAIYFIHVIIAASSATSATKHIQIYNNVISLILLYLQTVLLLQSRRYVPKNKNLRRFLSFPSICVVLSLLNFGLWITDTFIGMKFQAVWTTRVEVFGKSYWTFLMQYVFPLLMFYRLETGLTFLRLYKEFPLSSVIQP